MSNQECESNLFGCVFLTALTLAEVELQFNDFKAAVDNPDLLEIISFSSEKEGTITLDDIENCGSIDHEALARFISMIINPEDSTFFEVEFGGAKDHGWLVLNNEIHHLNYEPRVGNIPWEDFVKLHKMRMQQTDPQGPQEEVYYQWKEFISVDGEPPRLITPWANPRLYEFSFDFQFRTPEEALQGKLDFGAEVEDEWVLCKVTTSPLDTLKPDNQKEAINDLYEAVEMVLRADGDPNVMDFQMLRDALDKTDRSILVA